MTNQVKLVFFKSRAFGICQTAQAKITLKISGGLLRDHIPEIKEIIFQKLHNLHGWNTTFWLYNFCGRTMLQNNISMAKLLCSKNFQEFDD